MPTDHATPVNDLDRAARGAFAQLVGEVGALYAADLFGVDHRTIGRIAAGRRDVPPGLAREAARRIPEIGGDLGCQQIDALNAWANSREQKHG